MAIGGCILTQKSPNVEVVAISLEMKRTKAGSWEETKPCKYLASEPLDASKFIPKFDNATAHNLSFRGLPQLTELRLTGSDFHWALAKLSRLRKLQMSRSCLILRDEAPNEFNIELKILDMCARSEILQFDSVHYVNFKKFLAHFP